MSFDNRQTKSNRYNQNSNYTSKTKINGNDFLTNSNNNFIVRFS